MSMTVLLDLDDTLLVNSMDTFLPAYLQALSANLDTRSPEHAVRQVLVATRLMVANTQPDRTLEQVFDEAFYPAIGASKQELWGTIERFYREVFPALQNVTRPCDGGVELVEYLFERNHRVVIATNPLFPRTATQQRLAWAGLPVDRYPFDLVTTYESFHFAKPDPAYYAEILAQLGWPEQPVVMIGDSLENDILPAEALGIPTFWLAAPGETWPAGLNPSSKAGSLADVIPWLEAVATEKTEQRFDSNAALLAVLKSTPAALDTLRLPLPPEQWNRKPSPGEWSLTEVLCHLRDVDREVNWPRMEKICTEDSPFLPGVDTDPWAEERQYSRQNGPEALAGFLETRTRILGLLASIPPETWQRPARHAIFGPTTLKELTGFIATHDRLHVRQAQAAIDAALGSR